MRTAVKILAGVIVVTAVAVAALPLAFISLSMAKEQE